MIVYAPPEQGRAKMYPRMKGCSSACFPFGEPEGFAVREEARIDGCCVLCARQELPEISQAESITNLRLGVQTRWRLPFERLPACALYHT